MATTKKSRASEERAEAREDERADRERAEREDAAIRGPEIEGMSESEQAGNRQADGTIVSPGIVRTRSDASETVRVKLRRSFIYLGRSFGPGECDVPVGLAAQIADENKPPAPRAGSSEDDRAAAEAARGGTPEPDHLREARIQGHIDRVTDEARNEGAKRR